VAKNESLKRSLKDKLSQEVIQLASDCAGVIEQGRKLEYLISPGEARVGARRSSCKSHEVHGLNRICNNTFQVQKMKRLFPTSLALLLVMASLGHVLAAAFCPRALGRECCFAKTAHHTHSSSSSHEKMAVHKMHTDGLSMDGMNMNCMNMGDMPMEATSMDRREMNDMEIDAPTVDLSILFSPPAFTEQSVANKLAQPVESCAHCLGHSGIVNAPVSFVSGSNESGKEIESVLLSVSKFLNRPAIAPAQLGLPGKHAPPGSSAPRHILISVFLI
jgi:hypothetical protein